MGGAWQATGSGVGTWLEPSGKPASTRAVPQGLVPGKPLATVPCGCPPDKVWIFCRRPTEPVGIYIGVLRSGNCASPIFPGGPPNHAHSHFCCAAPPTHSSPFHRKSVQRCRRTTFRRIRRAASTARGRRRQQSLISPAPSGRLPCVNRASVRNLVQRQKCEYLSAPKCVPHA